MTDPVVVKLTISLHQSGNVNIDGIPDQKLIFYGILESVKEAAVEYYKNQATKLVQPAFKLPGQN